MDFENNESEFDKDVDFFDLKSAINGIDSDQLVDIAQFLKDVGCSQSKLNVTKTN